MANERVEGEFVVPASTTVTVSTGALSSAVSVNITAGTTFLTSFLADWQTSLNLAVTPYPQSPAAMQAAVGYGTWTTGAFWACQETSGNLAATFGSPTLTATSLTYGNAGPGNGGDLAIGFDAAADSADGGNNFDVGAADDLIVAWVGYEASVPGSSLGLISKFNSTGWTVQYGAGGFINFNGVKAGPTSDFLASVAIGTGAWYVGIAVIDRSTGKARIGVRTLAGTTTVSAEQTATASSYTTAGTFRLGQRSDAGLGAFTDSKLAGVYVVKGAGVATGLSANLSTALSNFASAISSSFTISRGTDSRITIANSFWTYSLTWGNTDMRSLLGFTADISSVTTATGTKAAKGVFVPNCPIAADSDVKQAPTGDDRSATISPTGRVYSLANSEFYRHRNVRFSHVAQHLVWSGSATYANQDWETFYLDTQLAHHAWFSVGSRVKVYWDNAGTATLVGSGTVSAWSMPKCVTLDELRLAVNGWTGLVEINLGDLYGAT